MHKPHPTFERPEDPEVKIWRYMDFTKLVSLLDTSSLWFTRADMFGDQFEGSYPRMNVLARQTLPADVPEDQRPGLLKLLREWSDIGREWPRYVAVNCWHINEYESAAMWSLYLKSNEGIAIQSTYERLGKAFSVTAEDVFIGKVSYIDYESQVISDGNILSPFLHKRKSYEHERELRALIVKWPQPGEKGLDFTIDTIEAGVPVSVELDALVESIYVAPDAPTWFTRLVESVAKKYGREVAVRQSSLNATPLY